MPDSHFAEVVMRIVLLLGCAAVFTVLGNAAVIHVPAHHATIQDAINAAVDGDTVIVVPGTYVETIDFMGKAIIVKSEQGPDVTIIDGDRTGSVVTFRSGEDLASIIEGFTIQKGSGTYNATYSWYEGGGIYLLNSSATIRGCTMRNNSAGQGAGIGTRNASPEVTDCLFTNNTAIYSGGGMGLFESSTGLISSCTFQGNTCYGSFDGGGGIYCQESSPFIDACHFTENDAPGGGAIRLRWYSDATISNCSIVGNTANSLGGIGCERSSPIITGCRITDNVAGMAGGIGMDIDSRPVITGNTISYNIAETSVGGGIYCHSPPQEIADNLIEGNTAGQDGGGIHWACSSLDSVIISGNTIRGNSASLYDGRGGGINFTGSSSDGVLIEDNTIEGNSAELGGGLYFFTGDCRLLRNLIIRNRADCPGGGVYTSAASLEIINCVIAQNEAILGGGIFCSSFSTITNCTIVDNRADEGAGLYFNALFADITFINSILWDRPTGSGCEIYVEYYSNDPIISYSNVRGGWPGTGNIAKPPLFAENGELDYHLTYNSPCRDAGDNAAPGLPIKDFEWDPRIADTAVDMGFDEFHRHLYHSGTVTPGAWVKLKVVGTPGLTPVQLGLGSGVQDPPMGIVYGRFWLQLPLEAIFLMPDIDDSGVAERCFKVPTDCLPGEEFPFQALLGPRVPGSHFTNLHVLEVE